MARLQEKYRAEVLPLLAKELGRANPHALAHAEEDRRQHGPGQGDRRAKAARRSRRPPGADHRAEAAITKSRKAVSGFRLREGMEVGCLVTLRGKRMFEFLDRLISLALPRVRDFRGLNPNGFDGRGNFSLGLNEQLVFPEIPADKTKYIQGMNITLVTSADTDDEGRLLLKHLGMPFRKS